MKKSFLVLLTVGLLCCVADVIIAQSPSLQNLQSVNVDDLSDDQIRQFVQKAKSSGYTEDQLMIMAQSRGMSAIQIQKLKQRIDQLGVTDNTLTDNNVSRIRTAPEHQGSILVGQDPFLDVAEKGQPVSNVFGLNFFRNAKLNFEPGLNMPTPVGYILGAGDELIIDIWGASEQTYQVTISPEGNIRIPNLGPIYLNGLTIERAKSRIIYNLKKIYRTIGGSSQADVTLGQIRTINIHVIGAVDEPGTYPISSFGTVFNALYVAGGPTEKGSLRLVEIFRQNKKIATFDAYDFFVRGQGDNIPLQDQDVVIVRPFQNRVKLSGQVKNPAIYEMMDGETLEDLFYYAGGFTPQAYKGVFSVRRNENNYRTVKSVLFNEVSTLQLNDGDELTVASISNLFKGRVVIEGALFNPGEFEFKEGMKLSELIKKANGLRGDAFQKRGIIIREAEDLTLSSVSFVPSDILEGNSDLDLQENDIVKISSIYDLRENYNIRIQGEVLKPGSFPYVEGMTVENLIFLAKGFKESAAKSFVEVARRIDPENAQDDNKSAEIYSFLISSDLSLSDEASKFELLPFDLVVVRRDPFFNDQEVIEVEGEVKYPGKYSLEKKNERISDVLKRAGGLTKYAYAKGATLIRRTEYYETDELEGDEGARQKREDLESIVSGASDDLTNNVSIEFKRNESIGIQLEEIVNNPGSKHDLILKEGDVISIPKELQTVRIRGEVLYPSNVRRDERYTFKEYISQAGGFSDNAKKSKAYVIYANGSAARTKSFLWFKNYPKIEPGAEVIIPSKPERQPMTAQGWIALSTSVATLALVVRQLANN